MNLSIKTIFLICFLSFSLLSQNSKYPVFFNEFHLSGNFTLVQNENTANRFGGGLGIYRSWRNDKWFQISTGICYDFTRQLKKNVYNGNFSTVTNATYQIHSLSIPFMVRFNMGKKTKFFIEPGVFVAFNLAANRKGTFKTLTANSKFTESYKEEQIKLPYTNGGSQLFIGVNIPIGEKYSLVPKIGYVFSIRNLGNLQENLFNRYLNLSFGFRMN